MLNVIKYYEHHDEDNRITSTNARKIEFIITTSTLDKYIRKEHKILEVGAGTGVYSFYYADKGNEVVATDLTPNHVEIIKEKLSMRDKKS